MRIHLKELAVVTRRATELVQLADRATFIYGPVGKGKSTTARLIDYCFGGSLERTPAIQKEFVSAILSVTLGQFDVRLERSATDASSVRVTWSRADGEDGSVNAPLDAGSAPLVATAYNLSDLIFWLCGVTPMKVRKSKINADADLVRLSFRDVFWYCYLEQLHLDSSFFRMEDTFKRLKSRDVMRFVTGFHSERLAELDALLVQTMDEQRGKREAVQQIRDFMVRFGLGSDVEIAESLAATHQTLEVATAHRRALDQRKSEDTHPVEPLRARLRGLSGEIDTIVFALADLREQLSQQQSLRAELITAKIKASRVVEAVRLLEGAAFVQCPQCGSDLSGRIVEATQCHLCGEPSQQPDGQPGSLEPLRIDLNERIDELEVSIDRKTQEVSALERHLAATRARKAEGDQELARRLAEYDSAFVASARDAERTIAQMEERVLSLERLKELPKAIASLEIEAGALQGTIDSLRAAIAEERGRLSGGERHALMIARRFHQMMLAVGFPGVYADDTVILNTRTWLPVVKHGDQEWGFYDAGSGGKKTLFNVCFALAVHQVATEEDLPLPAILIIDSPTKNISEDMDPAIVTALYREIYRMAMRPGGVQFLLIDSDLVPPTEEFEGLSYRQMAGTPQAPCLIPYYDGP
jgi:hypothetical protein